MSAIALYVVSTLSAPFFVRPRDSLANALVSAPMLFTVNLSTVPQFQGELEVFRWAMFWLVVSIGGLAVLAIAFQHIPKSDTSWRGKASRVSYELTVPVGSEVVAFTPPALISILGFHQQNLVALLWLTAIWVIVVTVKPVQLMLQIWGTLRQVRGTKGVPEHVGQVTRVDDLNLIRVALTSAASWKPERLHMACLPGDRHVDVIPLFVQTQDVELIGTGLFSDGKLSPSIDAGQVWTAPDDARSEEVVQRLAGQNTPVHLIGFVVEESNISAVRFEIANTDRLSEGDLFHSKCDKRPR